MNIHLFDEVITDTGFEGEVQWFAKIGERWFARVQKGDVFVMATLNALTKVRHLEVTHL